MVTYCNGSIKLRKYFQPRGFLGKKNESKTADSIGRQPLFQLIHLSRLTASAATMEAPAHRCAGVAAITNSAAVIVPVGTGPVVAAAVIAVPSSSVVAIPSPITPARPVVAVIPRPCANEDAAHEPSRPIVAIRRARVRIIGVIAVGACRCRTHVARAHANAHCDLGLRVCYW